MNHLVDIEDQVKSDGSGRYRWRCTCGEFERRWHNSHVGGRGAGDAERRARAGGEVHAGAKGGRVEWPT